MKWFSCSVLVKKVHILLYSRLTGLSHPGDRSHTNYQIHLGTPALLANSRAVGVGNASAAFDWPCKVTASWQDTQVGLD